MLLAGVRRYHAFEAAASGIPRQWDEFNALRPIAGQKGTATYGAICGTRPGEVEYMCAIEVESFDGLPTDLGRMRLPEQLYAIFTHSGHISTIRQTWQAIMGEWLPGSGYKSAQTPDFELYDERYDPETATGDVEIWFPITPAG